MPEILTLDDAIEIDVIDEMLAQHENFMAATMQLDALTMHILDETEIWTAFIDTEIRKHEFNLV